jgi:hypothetical protein
MIQAPSTFYQEKVKDGMTQVENLLKSSRSSNFYHQPVQGPPYAGSRHTDITNLPYDTHVLLQNFQKG